MCDKRGWKAWDVYNEISAEWYWRYNIYDDELAKAKADRAKT